MTIEQEFASPSSNTQTVYAAIELSKKNWVISVAHPDQRKPSIYRLLGGDFDALVARLRKVAGSIARIVICYEAGYDGFWLARRLTRSGIECRVLDPASLQVNRRARRVKTDRIDALMLLRAVIAIDRGDHHVCAEVRVPDVEEEDARRSHRERQRLVHERTAHINRIKGLLFGQGIRVSNQSCARHALILPPLSPPKVNRFPNAYAMNSNVNIHGSLWSRSRSAASKRSAIWRMRKTLPSSRSVRCFAYCPGLAERLPRSWRGKSSRGSSVAVRT
jgi:hypothetical protein